MIRLLLADDHPIVRDGLAAVLSDRPDFEVIGAAATAAEAAALARQHQPDVLLLDLEMPGGSGADILPALLSDLPDLGVLIFTAYDTDERILSALRAGARGYLLKGAPAEEIARAIRIVHAGGSYLEPHAASAMLSAVQGRAALPRPEPTPLSEREREVLRYVVDGLSNKQIARHLGITERTVKFHLSSVLRKLDADSRARAAVLAVQRGLL